MRRVDEEGEHALLQLPDRVSRFPDFVRFIVRQLKAYFPGLGKKKIAQILARAGLHLGVTTVGRILKEKPVIEVGDEFVSSEGHEQETVRVVTSKYPGHIVLCDLTVVPTAMGFWVPWLPQSLLQSWPFGWWVAVVIDHFSRKVLGFAIFKRKPVSLKIRSFLGRALQKSGMKPRHIITDRDKIFDCPAFVKWCRRKGMWPRYGAVGKYGSVSIIERFIRSMKNEGTRKIRVPLSLNSMRRETSYYVNWYNQHRPHSGLLGKTPVEMFKGKRPANKKPRYEPRLRWPRGSPCAVPWARVKGKTGAKLVLVLQEFQG
jgi:putative transposase